MTQLSEDSCAAARSNAADSGKLMKVHQASQRRTGGGSAGGGDSTGGGWAGGGELTCSKLSSADP